MISVNQLMDNSKMWRILERIRGVYLLQLDSMKNMRLECVNHRFYRTIINKYFWGHFIYMTKQAFKLKFMYIRHNLVFELNSGFVGFKLKKT